MCPHAGLLLDMNSTAPKTAEIDKSRHPDADTIKAELSISDYLGFPLKDLKLCRSPLRHDDNPSFSVFLSRNHPYQICKDNTLHETYDVIRLHMRLTGCTRDQACQELAKWDGPVAALAGWSPYAKRQHKSGGKRADSDDKGLDPNIGVRSSRPVNSSNYIVRNHLVVPQWVIDQLKCFQDRKGNLCYHSTSTDGIHFKGNKVQKSENKWGTFTGWIGDAGYSVCGNPESSEVWIWEGIGDFLALLQSVDASKAYHILTNSTGQIQALLDVWQPRASQKVYLCLDLDAGGDLGTKELIEGIKRAEGVQIFDCRQALIGVHEGCKDLLDVYMLKLKEKEIVDGE